ncbi:halogenase [Dulcicalothrix desertica PCC 7102]|uniref:Halogenase n=1 Tax=Dulcicalothrix desertica PCC 7102 TaxID=232991 RepID=A0A433VCS3_9CYAN|nr:tryptophan 7-halogenase [Dulcicalothrix desertica]RUT03906.1 halogenase [Dulcicalothrix desertica PCC 7102]TWH43684.1 flavin-dependent dehydrogenase [Dulcicalothrix desertica PCC 7102]
MMNTEMFAHNVQTQQNNTEKNYDVVVIGAGPIGIFYAAMLKKMRPQTTIALLERKAKPGHKVGESTLSTTVRAFRAMGLSMPVLRRLFGKKAGLRFFHTHPDTDQLEKEIDVVDIEETFQVERRVLEMVLQETVRRRGIDILTNTTFIPKASTITAAGNQLVCETATGEHITLHSHLVVDASGPASMLPKHFGVYRKNMEMYDTFNCNAYYAYFKLKKDVALRFWEYPTTRHITFPGGWMWFITLVSWQKTPDANLAQIVKRLLDESDAPDPTYPTRKELEAEYGGQSEQMISVGLTIRADQDDSHGSIGDRFAHYVKKHPAIEWLMSHYELVEEPYPEQKFPWFSVTNMAHDAEQFAGDGWCAIGDAALFSNPIISPGMTFGTGTSYMAACDSAAGLDRKDLSRATFAKYETYARTLIDALLDDTDTLYRSFAHVDSYERVLANKFFSGIEDILERTEYSATDPYVWNFLHPDNMQRIKAVKVIFQEGEKADKSPTLIAQEVSALITPYIAEVTSRPEIVALRLGRFFNFYDDLGHYAEKASKERGNVKFMRCSSCNLFTDDALSSCPVCGEPINHQNQEPSSNPPKQGAIAAIFPLITSPT